MIPLIAVVMLLEQIPELCSVFSGASRGISIESKPSSKLIVVSALAKESGEILDRVTQAAATERDCVR